MSIEITFSKSGQGDIVLTEHDLFEFRVEKKCFDNTFELGGVVADELYIIIDNAGGYTKQAFAGTRAAVKLDGNLIGYFNSDIPKRRGGIIELYAYGDMLKTDTAMPEWALPVTFLSAYPNLATHCGLSPTVIYNGVSDVGIIMPSFEEYLKTQSCRNILAAMSEFNGGFCWIDTDLKLNIGKFEKTVSHEYSSFDLLDFDYSDETIAFSKVKMANGSIAVEFGDDSGFTLTLNTDYLTTGLDESDLMMLVELIADYYIGMELTPMTLTLPAPDYTVKLGDRIKVHVNDDNIDVYGNISRIEYTDNLVQTIECGGFGGTERPSYTTTKSSIATAEKKAESGGAKVTNNYLTAINQSAVALTSEYKTVAELSFEAASTTNALIPVIIQPDSNVQVSSRLRLGLTTISERQYVNGYTEILPNLSATQQTLYLDCKSDTAAVLPTGKTSIGLVAENVNLWVDTTIVTCEYYFESDGTYDLYSSASAAWIDYGDGSAQGTSKSHYYTAGTYIVKFKSLYHAYGYPLFASRALRRIISGRLSQSSSPWGAFRSCTALLSINADFFHDLSSVDLNFGGAFESCSALVSIPAKILAPIANRCKYLNNIFRYCSALTSIPASLFDGVPNTSGVNFSSAFTNCSAVTSAVPELWVTHSNATHDSYTFMGCTSAANYSSIPSTWR